VGRLDLDATGCLLLSNDGDFIQFMLHPRHEITKTYRVLVKGQVQPETLQKLREGVRLEEGLARADTARILEWHRDGAVLQLIIHQGWKRQIKRMCVAVGHPVQTLHRSAIAFLTVEGLPEGASRRLTAEELRGLQKLGKNLIKPR
jgi:23S rRNA pseudouridine2605 synthase